MEKEERRKTMRRKKIGKSGYAHGYNGWMQEGIPGCLKEKGRNKSMKTMARLRLDNKWSASRYWMKKEKKICRACFEAEETWLHVLKVCDRIRTEEGIEIIMNGRKEGIKWLKRVIEEKKNKVEEVKDNSKRNK